MAQQVDSGFIDYLRRNFDLTTNRVGDAQIPIFNSFRCLPTNGTTRHYLEVPGPHVSEKCNQWIQIEAGARVRIVTRSESEAMGYYGKNSIAGLYIQRNKWKYNFEV